MVQTVQSSVAFVFSPRAVEHSVGLHRVSSPKETPPLSKLLQPHGRQAAKRCRLLCFSPSSTQSNKGNRQRWKKTQKIKRNCGILHQWLVTNQFCTSIQHTQHNHRWKTHGQKDSTIQGRSTSHLRVSAAPGKGETTLPWTSCRINRARSRS